MHPRFLVLVVALGALAAADAPDPAAAANPTRATRAVSLGDAVAAAARTAGARDAVAAYAEREALARLARADLLPDLAGVGAVERRHQIVGVPPPRTFNEWSATLSVRQPLIDLAAWRRYAAARGDRDAAAAEKAVARETAAQSIALAYARLARASLFVVARDADERLAAELSRIAEAQAEAGTVERLVATRARTRLATAQGEALAARQEREQARIALVRAFEGEDVEVETTTALDESFADLELPADGDAAAHIALGERPELTAAEAAVRAADERRGAAAAGYYPRLDASGDAGRVGAKPDDTTTAWDVGAAVTVPLPVDGSVAADRDAATARLARARIALEDARRAIAAEVRDAVAALAAGKARLGIARAGLALAEQEVAQERARFEAGATDNQALVESQLRLGTARDTDIEARTTIADARIRLAHALGRATRLR